MIKHLTRSVLDANRHDFFDNLEIGDVFTYTQATVLSEVTKFAADAHVDIKYCGAFTCKILDKDKMRYGAVLVFKEDVPKEQAEAVLKSLSAILDCHPLSPLVHSFDPRFGGPVWYIP